MRSERNCAVLHRHNHITDLNASQVHTGIVVVHNKLPMQQASYRAVYLRFKNDSQTDNRLLC